MTDAPDPIVTLDVRHLKCPLASLVARRLLRRVTPGTTVKLLADDRASLGGFQKLCRAPAHKLLFFENGRGAFSLTIRKDGDAAHIV